MYWQCKWRVQEVSVATKDLSAKSVSFRLSVLVILDCFYNPGKEMSSSRSWLRTRDALPGLNCAWRSSPVICHLNTPNLCQSLWSLPIFLYFTLCKILKILIPLTSLFLFQPSVSNLIDSLFCTIIFLYQSQSLLWPWCFLWWYSDCCAEFHIISV